LVNNPRDKLLYEVNIYLFQYIFDLIVMVSKIKASHILVDKHSQAIEIIGELKKGANFANLARKYSNCPSRKRGGSLGSFGRGQMVKEFEKAAFALGKNEFTNEPVKTKFGYHIIKRTR
jgi:parvulin-like peptidyl-prolyl isomerase